MLYQAKVYSINIDKNHFNSMGSGVKVVTPLFDFLVARQIKGDFFWQQEQASLTTQKIYC